MIETIHPEFKFRTHFLQAYLSDANFIQALATQLVAGQVEAHLDMIQDAGSEEYSTYKDVADCVAGAKESVQDYMEDLMAEFRDALFEAVNKVNIDTKAVLLKPDGEIDADVTVSYNVK